MKDNDFRGKAKIRLPPSVGDELIEQLYADCTFLAEVYEVMDYSLLGKWKGSEYRRMNLEGRVTRRGTSKLIFLTF